MRTGGKRLVTGALVAAAVSASSSALAFTECAHTIATIYRGDNGFMQIVFNGTPNAYLNISSSNADFKDWYAMASLALVNRKTVVLRYAVDGVACGTVAEQNRSDLIGMTMYQ